MDSAIVFGAKDAIVAYKNEFESMINEKSDFRGIHITEESIADAFGDFICNIKSSNLVYNDAETLKIIGNFINALK